MTGTIIKLHPGDYQRLTEIRELIEMDEKWQKETLDGERIIFAFEQEGRLLGEGSLVLTNDDPDYTIANKRVYLSRLVVNEDNRRSGIGNALVVFLTEEAKKMGFTECSVGVNKDNEPALELYKKHGFDTVIFDGEDEYGAYYKLLKTLSPLNITVEHEIFTCDDYTKDAAPFSLIEMIKSAATLLVSDGKSYLVCSMELPGAPDWIWTADDIPPQSLEELATWYAARFTGEKKPFFVSKPHVADSLIEKLNPNMFSRIGMEAFECPQIIPPKCSLIPEKATEKDVDIIGRMMGNFQLDCFGENSVIPREECLKRAGEFLENPLSFIIRIDGKPVAMAKSGRESDKHLSVNGVYTIPQYRAQGLAAALVAHISSIILSLGKTPLLYTDLSNPYSNKSYTNVGFLPRGRVDEVRVI